MRIEVKLFHPNKKEFGFKPESIIFSGNYAFETMLIKLSEKYISPEVSRQIESILKKS